MRLAWRFLPALAACAALLACSVTPAPPARPADWVEARCALAEAARREDRGAEALAGFRAVLEADPACAAAHRGYQDLLLAQGKGDELRAEYGELAERLGEPWSLELYGRVLFDPVREEELYRRALEREPDSLSLNKALSSALHRQLRFEEAVQVDARCIALAPLELEAHLHFVSHSLKLGRDEEVRAKYEDLLLQDPGSVIAHLALLDACARRSNLEQAAVHLKCVQELAPDAPESRQARLALAVKRDDRAEFEAALRACLEADPTDVDALGFAGMYLIAKDGDEEAGADMLREAERLAPTSSMAISVLGKELLKDWHILEAEPLLDEALRRNPADFRALTAKARLAAIRKKRGEARELYEKARSVEDIAWLRRDLFHLYKRMQAFDEAAALLDSTGGLDGFASHDPDERARDLLAAAQIYLFLGRAEDAWKLASAEIDAETCHPVVLGAAALVLERRGDVERATLLLERAVGQGSVELDPKDGARLHAQLARLLLKGERREEAYAEYRTLWWEYSNSIPRGLPILELVKALDATPHAAECRLLPDVIPVRVHGVNSCLGDATAAALEHCGGSVEPADLELLLKEKQLSQATSMLDQAAGLDAVPFLVDRDSVKRLIEMGRPVLVTLTNLYEDGQFGGHAALALGYDDRLGVVHVADSGYLKDSGLASYADIEGRPGIAILPEGAGEEARAWLPGVEYCRLLQEAELCAAQGGWDAARDVLERALAVNPDSPFAYWMLLGVRRQQGTLDDPAELLERICALPGAEASHFDQLGHFRFHNDDLAGARAAFWKALASLPDCVHVWAHLVEVAMQEEDSPDSVLIPANRVLDLDPYHAVVLGCRGYARLWAGDTNRAVEDLELSLGLEESSQAWWHLATAREQLDDLPGALSALRRYEGLVVDQGAQEEQLQSLRERIDGLSARLAAAAPAKSEASR